MHAIVCSEFAPIERLAYRQLPAPEMGPGQVRIAVHAAGVNFPDALIVQGLYQSRPELPFIPGNEISGVVTEVAPDVSTVRQPPRPRGRRTESADAVVRRFMLARRRLHQRNAQKTPSRRSPRPEASASCCVSARRLMKR